MKIIEKVLTHLKNESEKLGERRNVLLEELHTIESRLKEINKEAAECYKIRPELYNKLTIGVVPKALKRKKSFNWAGMIDFVLTKYPDLIFNSGELEAMFIREGLIQDKLERNQAISLHVILKNMARNKKLDRVLQHGRWCYKKH